MGYLTAGLELVGDDLWSSDYDLAFALHLEAAECQYHCGNFAEAEQRFPLLLRRAATSLDQAKVYRLRSVQYENMSRYADALATARECLGLFGVSFPDAPEERQAALEGEIASIRSLLGRAQHRIPGRSPGHDRPGNPDGHEHPDRYLGLDLYPWRAGPGPTDLRHHGAPLTDPRQRGRVGLRLRDPRDHRRADAGGLPVGLRVRPSGLASERALQRPPAPGQDPPAVSRPCESLAAADGYLHPLCARGLPERSRERRFPVRRLRRRHGSLAGDGVDPGPGAVRPRILAEPGADQKAEGGRLRRFNPRSSSTGRRALQGRTRRTAFAVGRGDRRERLRGEVSRQPVLHGHSWRRQAPALLPVRRARPSAGSRPRCAGREPPLGNDLAGRVRFLERPHACRQLRHGHRRKSGRRIWRIWRTRGDRS